MVHLTDTCLAKDSASNSDKKANKKEKVPKTNSKSDKKEKKNSSKSSKEQKIGYWSEESCSIPTQGTVSGGKKTPVSDEGRHKANRSISVNERIGHVSGAPPCNSSKLTTSHNSYLLTRHTSAPPSRFLNNTNTVLNSNNIQLNHKSSGSTLSSSSSSSSSAAFTANFTGQYRATQSSICLTEADRSLPGFRTSHSSCQLPSATRDAADTSINNIPVDSSPPVSTWQDALESTPRSLDEERDEEEAKGGTLKANLNEGPTYREDTNYRSSRHWREGSQSSSDQPTDDLPLQQQQQSNRQLSQQQQQQVLERQDSGNSSQQQQLCSQCSPDCPSAGVISHSCPPGIGILHSCPSGGGAPHSCPSRGSHAAVSPSSGADVLSIEEPERLLVGGLAVATAHLAPPAPEDDAR